MSVTYTQNFDFLSSSTSPVTWVDNQGTQDSMGSPGWYWLGSLSTYTVDNGMATGDGRYSYGPASNGDRALGSLTAGSSSENVWGLVIRNLLSDAIIGLEISFAVEKWRDGTATSDSITFSYKTSTTNITDLETASVLPGGWTAVPALDFTVTDAVGVGPVDGNDPLNRTTLTQTISVTVPVGQYIALRWYDDDVSGGDHGIATDDLMLTAVPEPSAVRTGVLVWGVAVLAFIVRRQLANRANVLSPASADCVVGDPSICRGDRPTRA
jgi:hypothetical protein